MPKTTLRIRIQSQSKNGKVLYRTLITYQILPLIISAVGTLSAFVGVTLSTDTRAARAAAARNSALSDVVVNNPLVSLNAHSVTMRETYNKIRDVIPHH